MRRPVENLVFGGGASSLAPHAAAVRELHGRGMLDDVGAFAGTGLGSILAALLAAGCDPPRAADAAETVHFSAFFRRRPWSLSDGVRMATEGGLYDAQAVRDTARFLLARTTGQPDVPFRSTAKPLVITATNIRRGGPVYFSARTTPDMPVHEAIAITCSTPLLFRPDPGVAYGDLLGDGSLSDVLPLHVYDHPAPNRGTLGILAVHAQRAHDAPTSSTLAALLASLHASLYHSLTRAHLPDEVYARTLLLHPDRVPPYAARLHPSHPERWRAVARRAVVRYLLAQNIAPAPDAKVDAPADAETAALAAEARAE